MFFNSLEQIPEIAKKTGFSIFVIPKNSIVNFKNALNLNPDEKTKKISVDSVREYISKTTTKQTSDWFFVVNEPETMQTEAANTFLKTLEEPKENYHFVFLTDKPSALLPTILSRAQIYFLKQTKDFATLSETTPEIKELAKQLMTIRNPDLPSFAKKIADKKDRNFALEVVATTIEMSYKTFFLTNNPRIIQKLPNLLELYENISMNGHIKLHFVADML